MKKFITYFIGVLALLIAVLFVLNILYTTIYSTSSVRNKIQMILNAPPKHYDAIFIGSSRAENHIVTDMFKGEGLTTYNFGMSGANLCDTSLLLKLFFENGNTVDKVLLELDLNYMTEEPAIGIEAISLPYSSSKTIIKKHYSNATWDNFFINNLPFYKYCIFDSKIGFRELMMSIMHRKSNLIKTDGFKPLEGILNHFAKFELPKEIKQKNKYYLEIKSSCKNQGVKLISFATPMCKYATNQDFFIKLKNRIPELIDYSSVVKSDTFFSTCGHMNKNGARVFTRILINEHFKN